MVLEAVTDPNNSPRTIDELAALVGLTRSNAHRTLQTLVHAGYVIKDEQGGGYRGTIRLFELGARQLAQLDVRKEAITAMRMLADKTGETVHLSVLDDFDVVYIDKIDSLQPIRAYSIVGGRAPAYAVATGKALLAHQGASYIDRYSDSFTRHTKTTLTSMAALKKDLAKAVTLGYAVNRGEWREGVGGVGVAIFNSRGEAIAALGISGPLDRLTAAHIRKFAPEVVRCAQMVSHNMGFRA